MTDELKPCPFCGGQVTGLRRTDTNTSTVSSYYVTVCKNRRCQADGPWAPDVSGAIAKWNKRHLSPEEHLLDPVLAALEAIDE